MEAAMVGAAVKVVLQNLISVSTKEIKLIRGYKKDLEKLRSTLITIQGFVDGAEVLQVTDVSVRRWLKKLEEIAFQAYYVLDEIDYLSLRKDHYKMETETTFKKKIRSIASGSNYYDRLKLGYKIGKINKDFELINREASSLGLTTRLACLHATGVTKTASASQETDSYSFGPVFLGRDDDVKEMVEKLANIQSDQVFSILPIVGMGGMGKSTLSREVLKVQTRFQTHIWVHVSANFHSVVLFKKILMVVTFKDVKDENREVVLKKLQEALKNKTYLLVLDDVWNEDRVKWDDFIKSLSGATSTKGNGIIVTTRKRCVASIVPTLAIHELKGLPDDSCWSIIKASAFAEDDNILPDFETLGKNIAKRCQGLPLAANIVGGVLYGKPKHKWLSIQEKWLSDHDGDFIQKILKLSFDNLHSPSLKKCFAYCSIFPKGVQMMKADLIQLWMAEGYLVDAKSDMETVGEMFFDHLLHISLLQYAGKELFSNELVYSMHDLVHDVAESVNENIFNDIYGVRYAVHEIYEDICKEKANYVRTLFFLGTPVSAMFSDLKSLHALTLLGVEVKQLPSSISELMHLRYLNISNTTIEYLPDTIGELYHLQTLRALSYHLTKLPSTLKYLISLRHLHVHRGTELPSDLGMLVSLRTIPYFAVGDEKGHRIVELGSLKNIKGRLKIYNLEKVRDKEEAKSACIHQKPNIVELELHWSESGEGETDYENVLEGLQPHPNLKSLDIFGFNGSRFPSWARRMAVQDDGHWEGLNNLKEIKLTGCSKCEEIPIMGHLPHLKYLFLSSMRNVKSIGSSFYGIDHCMANDVCKDTITVFPALERLELSLMPTLRDWAEVELASASENQSCKVKVFPCLKYLVIKHCRELRSAPRHFPCLKEVKIEYMDSGLPLATICGTKLTSLTKLRIKGVVELESLPRRLFYNNQHLTEFEIQGCPRLRELPNGLHTLNSLQVFSLQECSRLKSIPDCSSGSFTSLLSLVIQYCGELINLSCEMVESCAPSLELLHIEGIRSVLNMQTIIDCLLKTSMPRLEKLVFASLPKFIITSSTETPTFPNLRELSIHLDSLPSDFIPFSEAIYGIVRELSIHPNSDPWDCVSFKEAVDGILMLCGSHSLRSLELGGVEDWDTLPDQLQHLSTISTLKISGLGIQGLPEWFGNLSSLWSLTLCFCWMLRSLPSVEAMRRLTNLTDLQITCCLALKLRGIEQQSECDDSEWPKISHLPYIIADWKNVRD